MLVASGSAAGSDAMSAGGGAFGDGASSAAGTDGNSHGSESQVNKLICLAKDSGNFEEWRRQLLLAGQSNGWGNLCQKGSNVRVDLAGALGVDNKDGDAMGVTKEIVAAVRGGDADFDPDWDFGKEAKALQAGRTPKPSRGQEEEVVKARALRQAGHDVVEELLGHLDAEDRVYY